MPFSLFSSSAPSIPLPISNSPLPKLFIAEGILKVLGGSIFFFSPTLILKNLAAPPYNASSLSLIQSMGTQTLAFSIPLFLAARGDFASAKSRKIVYCALLAREGFLGLGLLGQLGLSYAKEWWRGGFVGSAEAGPRRTTKERLMALARSAPSTGDFVMPGGWEEEEGEDVKVLLEREEQERLRCGLWLWVAELAPFVIGRAWILSSKGSWFD
ncbi:hypothetical protein K504DRAFT_501457 [Pleomassaria siparia CBS 279.74]|uniref:Uncharacterized protein n=1 Tax=Pleomassaria siparia CBS 279.74 TaxID=1314801 RepID=A0A6G1KCC3_9PLEO|nr:hypothetical protein K504DRAFT_501457 [Pleomassaria siparia CBS 279.74]